MKKLGEKTEAGADDREHHYLNRMRHHSSKYAEFHWPSVEMLINLTYTYDVIHSHLARKLDGLEKKYDAQFKVVFDALRQLMAPRTPSKRRPIGFQHRGEP